jgi:hypothetical protein
MSASSIYDVKSERSARAVDVPGRPEASGWLTFAAVMLGLAGTWNVVDGILAITRSHVFVANAHYVFSDLRTWGWIVMGLGAAQLYAAFTLLSGSQFARWFGIFVAGLNAIGQLMFLNAYPLWSLSMFAVDVMVIYALAVHAGPQLRRERA